MPSRRRTLTRRFVVAHSVTAAAIALMSIARAQAADCRAAERIPVIREVASNIDALTDRTLHESSRSEGMVCHLIEQEDANRLAECSQVTDAGTPETSARYSLEVAYLHLALAQNLSACHVAYQFDLDLFSGYASNGVASEEQLKLVRVLPSLIDGTQKRADFHAHQIEQQLKPLVDANNPGALQLMGILYMQPDLSTHDNNFAVDYLYRAGVGFLNAGNRERELRSLSGIQQIDRDHPLARRLQEQIYPAAQN